jgi:hypothetical protein
MKEINMSVSEEVAREQLDRIIAHLEWRIEQQIIHASVLTPRGDEAKKAQSRLALMLTGLAKLQTLRSEFYEPHDSPACRSQARGGVG